MVRNFIAKITKAIIASQRKFFSIPPRDERALYGAVWYGRGNQVPLGPKLLYLGITASLMGALGCGSDTLNLKSNTQQKKSQNSLHDGNSDAMPIENEWVRRSSSSSSTESSGSQDQLAENNKADVPVSVAGSFLSDCEWLSESENSDEGIGGCRIAQESNGQMVEDPIKVHTLLLKTAAGKDPIQRNVLILPGEGAFQVRFMIPTVFYGRSVSIDFQVDLGEKPVDFKDVMLTGLPTKEKSAKGGMVEIKLPSLPTLPSFVTQKVNAFKLGDDGLNNSVTCRGIEDKAIANQLNGSSAAITFALKDMAPIAIKFRRICGHGVGTLGSLFLARMEIWDQETQMMVDTAVLPPSSKGDDVPDGAQKTAQFNRDKILPKGKYELRVIPSKTAQQLRLDDMVIEEITVTAPGLERGGQLIK